MYSDLEVVETANEAFIRALGLLHSREHDSAEKLRAMLNASMEKKLAIVHDRERTRSKFATTCDNRTSEIDAGRNEDANRDSDITNREVRKMGVIEVESADESADGNVVDVPRISIPDESSDGERVVCKICKADRVGPLILLECQECQESYHPLCHQPAVVEIDVYDPRLVWRCGTCLETKHSFKYSPVLVNLENDDDNDDHHNETEHHRCDGFFRKFTTGLAVEKIDDKEATKIRNRGNTRPDATNSYGARTKNSTAQLRKRVGSKRSWI